MAAERPDSDVTVRITDAELGATLGTGRRVFGRYVLEREIGRGGMGLVWRARDETLGETVALKFLPASVSRDAEAVDELKEETRRARRLRHPNIVTVFDFVQDETGTAIAMELIEGTTLAQLRLQQPGKVFSTTALAPLIPQICGALDYAHAFAKIAHRDLKPANILVTTEGLAKIADFGIARSLSETHTRLTGKSGGGISGTLPYMSPQQVLGRKPSSSDDIYALGAMLYELLTSKPPFHRGDPYSLMMQIREQPPLPLMEQRAELEVTGEPIPRAWDDAIFACLAKEPAQRPVTAGEVAARLAAVPTNGPATDNKKIGAPLVSPAVIAVERVVKSAQAKVVVVKSALHYPASDESWPEEPEAEPASPLKYPGAEISVPSGGRFVGLLAVVLVAAVGWYFAVIVPARARQSDQVRVKDQKQVAAETKAVPEPGQPWTIPGLNLTLLPIVPGTFLMGSENGNVGEKPVTRVTLTQTFWMGKTEVIQREWSTLMGNNPSNFKGEALPVERVSWAEAMAFCRVLTERERMAGRLPEGYSYSLPTEAQWEYACRAETTGDYAGILADMAWYVENSGKKTHAAGTKRANAWGLADMHGNVWEWCSDWYADKLPGGSVRDPAGPASGSYRVNRGGAWDLPARNCRSAYRNGDEPEYHFSLLGFRVALISGR